MAKPNKYKPRLSLVRLQALDKQTEAMFLEFLRCGYFYLEMPERCRQLMKLGEDSVRSYVASDMTGEKHYDHRNQEKMRAEVCRVERADWQTLFKEGLFTKELIELATEMNYLALAVLERTLHLLDIPNTEWCRLTGGLADDQGAHYFSMQHYNREKRIEELYAYKNFGFITICIATNFWDIFLT